MAKNKGRRGSGGRGGASPSERSLAAARRAAGLSDGMGTDILVGQLRTNAANPGLSNEDVLRIQRVEFRRRYGEVNRAWVTEQMRGFRQMPPAERQRFVSALAGRLRSRASVPGIPNIASAAEFLKRAQRAQT